MNKLVRATAAAAIALSTSSAVALATIAPAEAGSRWTYRSAGEQIYTEWLELGALPGGVAGNAHWGYLEIDVDATPTGFGEVYDWTCPPGELPPQGGGGPHLTEEEPPPTNCILESVRLVKAEPGDIAVTLDRKLTSATVTGTLSVFDHDGGGTTARPPVNMTLTGVGSLSSSTSYERGEYDGVKYVYKYESTDRAATIAGNIGAMGFTDDPDDTSSASLSTYKIFERESSD